MRHDPELDTCLTSALEVLLQVMGIESANGRTHGSMGVIASVLSVLSVSEQLTQEQRAMVHDLINIWQYVLCPNREEKR